MHGFQQHDRVVIVQILKLSEPTKRMAAMGLYATDIQTLSFQVHIKFLQFQKYQLYLQFS